MFDLLIIFSLFGGFVALALVFMLMATFSSTLRAILFDVAFAFLSLAGQAIAWWLLLAGDTEKLWSFAAHILSAALCVAMLWTASLFVVRVALFLKQPISDKPEIFGPPKPRNPQSYDY